ncbi:hypothetical protein [Cylindrospermopsis raciborskii]|uniref:hypothetical protein n=1 Tax=Cylindrospermopsis raciborskii TaxID=77022 RepID=UPI00136665BD|nr:hypothetical protein [Cylindrospermopsis raciborskii]
MVGSRCQVWSVKLGMWGKEKGDRYGDLPFALVILTKGQVLFSTGMVTHTLY